MAPRLKPGEDVGLRRREIKLPLRRLLSIPFAARMKLSGSTYVLLAAFGCAAAARAASDYTRRNPAFDPVATGLPTVALQPTDVPAAVQNQRMNFPTIDRRSAALADRRAPIEVAETQRKKTLPPSAVASHPVARAPDLSALNHRLAAISTHDTRQPPLVSKYQDKLTSSQSVGIGRTPSLDHRGEARLNRFVFRHNDPAPLPSSHAAPAAGRAGEDSR